MASRYFRIIRNFLTDRKIRFGYLAKLGLYQNMSDEQYVKTLFELTFGYPLDLNNPQTFSEKLQWLKLHDRRHEYTTYVDKFAVRQHIAETIGEQYLIPLLGVWDDPEQIDFSTLPNQFVLKCNHNSGKGMYICTDKRKMNISKVKKDLHAGIKQDYYLSGREWPYKNVQRKIIAEKYMTDGDGSVELTDYKFFCFEGYVDCVMLCLERSTGFPKFYFFDADWRLLRLNVRGKEAPEGFTVPKPACMGEMFQLASILSKNLPFSRIDFYQCNDQVYFGEITFFPQSGLDRNLLPEAEQHFGQLLQLRKEGLT